MSRPCVSIRLAPNVKTTLSVAVRTSTAVRFTVIAVTTGAVGSASEAATLKLVSLSALPRNGA